jgi:hypothetical protein
MINSRNEVFIGEVGRFLLPSRLEDRPETHKPPLTFAYLKAIKNRKHPHLNGVARQSSEIEKLISLLSA